VGKQVLNPCIIQRQTFSQISRQHGQLSFKIFNAYIYILVDRATSTALYLHIFAKMLPRYYFLGTFPPQSTTAASPVPFLLSFHFRFFSLPLAYEQASRKPDLSCYLGVLFPSEGLSLYIYIYNIKIYIYYIYIYLLNNINYSVYIDVGFSKDATPPLPAHRDCGHERIQAHIASAEGSGPRWTRTRYRELRMQRTAPRTERMPERMSERMPGRMSERLQIDARMTA
jgi:hypothetical protein